MYQQTYFTPFYLSATPNSQLYNSTFKAINIRVRLEEEYSNSRTSLLNEGKEDQWSSCNPYKKSTDCLGNYVFSVS